MKLLHLDTGSNPVLTANNNNLNPKQMKKFLFNLRWLFDYYVIYFTYNPKKIQRYHRYMTKKYGNKYADLFSDRDGDGK